MFRTRLEVNGYGTDGWREAESAHAAAQEAARAWYRNARVTQEPHRTGTDLSRGEYVVFVARAGERTAVVRVYVLAPPTPEETDR